MDLARLERLRKPLLWLVRHLEFLDHLGVKTLQDLDLLLKALRALLADPDLLGKVWEKAGEPGGEASE